LIAVPPESVATGLEVIGAEATGVRVAIQEEPAAARLVTFSGLPAETIVSTVRIVTPREAVLTMTRL
jgi:hypothetical protein